MKDQLQKELKEKVKPGVKPSQLKRSKSASDIPLVPPLPQTTALTRSKSQEPFNDPKYPYTTLIAQREELEILKKETQTKSTTIALLRKKNEELEKQDQVRGEQNDALLAELAKVYEELNELKETPELDRSLEARHQNLKDWFKAYQKTKQLDKELSENINEASEELTAQDQKTSHLQSQNLKLTQANQSLVKDLALAQRLAESRRIPLPSSLPNPDYLKYTLYALSAV